MSYSEKSLYKEIFKGVYEIDILNANDSELEKISKERALGLSLEEMLKIQKYFKKEEKGRNPTDVELEAFAQSWSEHCCYKSSKTILEKTVFKVKSKDVILAIKEDAAVVNFDDEHAYVVKIESHNHPSALDPYGGAATGVGGILRDILCMGAQPLALIDSLFFGNLNFPENKIPEGIKSPRFLFKEVVKGIADYGNRVGIPTLSGMTYFDNSFLGNCLVNVGCVGIVKKDKIAHSRVGDDGDIYILAGGKTGRDGIHGVTFASQNFSCKEEERAAVQLGYAIMKEPLIHACLEINEKGLLTGMKDLGGGGLSCGASEMAFAADKGAIVELEKVLLKEENLKPWEIWVSESQERMLLSVKKKNVEKVLEIFEFWDVPAVVIGTIDSSKRIKVKFHGETVLDLDLEFLIKGVQYKRPYSFKERKKVDVEDPKFKIPNLKKITKKILSSPNIGSKESIIRRYDHEVRGNTILKPMQGIVNKETHGDATVIKPLKDSYKGIAITSDVNPSFCKLDPFLGAASAVEETIRNLVSVNSFPHTLVDCLNFGNPENPESLGAFVRGCEGLYFAANSFKIPFVSGNVSFYNESSLGKIAPTPTLLGIGIVDDVRKIISVDLKKEGNFFYIVGETKQELGGSEYYKILNFSERGVVPKVFPEETKKIVNSLLKAMNLSLVESCHDCSEGGIFVSAAEMAFGGDLGLNLDLERISSSIRTDFKLFSESNGRFLVEVKRKNAKEFEKITKGKGKKIGEVVKEKKIEIKDKNIDIEFSLDELRNAWKNAIEKEKG